MKPDDIPTLTTQTALDAARAHAGTVGMEAAAEPWRVKPVAAKCAPAATTIASREPIFLAPSIAPRFASWRRCIDHLSARLTRDVAGAFAVAGVASAIAIPVAGAVAGVASAIAIPVAGAAALAVATASTIARALTIAVARGVRFTTNIERLRCRQHGDRAESERCA